MYLKNNNYKLRNKSLDYNSWNKLLQIKLNDTNCLREQGGNNGEEPGDGIYKTRGFGTKDGGSVGKENAGDKPTGERKMGSI